MEIELDTIYKGNCLEGMKRIPDGSIDAIIWKDVDIDNHYEVSNMGDIRRKEYTQIMRNGRHRVSKESLCNKFLSGPCLSVSIKGEGRSVAKIVAKAFMDDGCEHSQVFHLNGDPLDNRVSNLSYFKPERYILDGCDGLSEKEYISNFYDVSRDGVITRKSDDRIIKGSKDNKGYLRVKIKVPLFSNRKDKRKTYKVHRLVAMLYLDDYCEELQVNHKNGIKTDNRVENLEMVTNRENVLHAWRVLDSSKRRTLISQRNSKRVASVMDGHIVREYSSITDAAKHVNSVVSNLVCCLKGRTRTAAGYKWIYI